MIWTYDLTWPRKRGEGTEAPRKGARDYISTGMHSFGKRSNGTLALATFCLSNARGSKKATLRKEARMNCSAAVLNQSGAALLQTRALNVTCELKSYAALLSACYILL